MLLPADKRHPTCLPTPCPPCPRLRAWGTTGKVIAAPAAATPLPSQNQDSFLSGCRSGFVRSPRTLGPGATWQQPVPADLGWASLGLLTPQSSLLVSQTGPARGPPTHGSPVPNRGGGCAQGVGALGGGRNAQPRQSVCTISPGTPPHCPPFIKGNSGGEGREGQPHGPGHSLGMLTATL